MVEVRMLRWLLVPSFLLELFAVPKARPLFPHVLPWLRPGLANAARLSLPAYRLRSGEYLYRVRYSFCSLPCSAHFDTLSLSRCRVCLSLFGLCYSYLVRY